MTQYTPGPWKVVSGTVETATGIPIACMDRAPGNGTRPVERDRNAHLIAAAPERLTVLAGFARFSAETGGARHYDLTGLCSDARALLARIEAVEDDNGE